MPRYTINQSASCYWEYHVIDQERSRKGHPYYVAMRLTQRAAMALVLELDAAGADTRGVHDRAY